MRGVKTAILIMAGVALAVGGYWYGTQRPPAAGSAVAGAAPGGAQKGQGGAAGKAPAGLVPVETAAVATAEMPQIVSTVGSLRSDESVTLRPEVAGRIVAIKFEEGQRVTKGATLIQLDAAVNAAELQQARTNLSLAKSKYDRAIDLSNRNFISGQARDESKSAYELADAAVALVEARLAKTEIKAPFAGIIGLRVVSIGDYVKEGADLVNLETIEPIKVDFRIPETLLRDVQAGQAIQVTLDALPGKKYDGKVIALNPLLDAAGRALVVRAQVRNQDALLRPGMFARVTLITKSKREVLVVAEETVVPQGTESFIFRIVEGKAVRTKVETGMRRDGRVEIVTGLNKGDVVVTAGQARLRDGIAVKVAGAAARKNAGKSADKGEAAAQNAPAGTAGKTVPEAVKQATPPS